MKAIDFIKAAAIASIALFNGCGKQPAVESIDITGGIMPTKAETGVYSLGGATLTLSSDSSRYSAVISFVQGTEYSFSGIENMQEAYPPDFFLYKKETNTLVFLLRDDEWIVEYYPEENSLRLSPDSSTVNHPMYILGNGHSSGTRWIDSFHQSTETFYNFQSPYYTVAPMITENVYQATVRLYTGNGWGDVRLEFYSDVNWTKSYMLTSSSDIAVNDHGTEVSAFEICDAGTATCNLHSTSLFNSCMDGGLFRMLIFRSPDSNRLDLTIDRLNDESELSDLDNYLYSLDGKLVYHSYDSYGDGTSSLWLFDFASKNLSSLSSSWTGISDAMNAKFSPDGKSIVFMGIDTEQDSWDIFQYNLNSSDQPINLTPKNTTGDFRDEDPVFSNDGTKILFKRGGRIAVYSFATDSISFISDADIELSMPSFSTDESKVIVSAGTGSSAIIAYWDINSNHLYDIYGTGVQEYYPCVIDSLSFYYVCHWSASDVHDKVMKGFWYGSVPSILPFNRSIADCSDPEVISKAYVVFSSTRESGAGGYDLYIGNETMSASYPLSLFNSSINTAMNELGANYWTK